MHGESKKQRRHKAIKDGLYKSTSDFNWVANVDQVYIVVQLGLDQNLCYSQNIIRHMPFVHSKGLDISQQHTSIATHEFLMIFQLQIYQGAPHRMLSIICINRAVVVQI